MKYYVKVILENGLISQDIDVFSTMEDAKMFKNLAEKAGNKAEIYEIELIPAELEKLHEYKIVSKLSVEKLQEQLNTAKKALTEIAGGHTVEDAIFNHQLIASEALAAIGGDDDNRGNSTKLPNKVVKDYIQRN